MKDIDLGKEYVIPSPGYRSRRERTSLEPSDEQDGLKCWQERNKQMECQSALEAAARAEGLPLDVSMNSHLEMLEEGHPKGKYRFGLNLLKPIRTTSKHPHPIDNAGLFSYTTFSWLTPLARVAHKKGELQTADVWSLSKHESSDVTCRRLERLWQQELQEHGPEEASLRRVVWVFCRTRLIISIMCLMVTQLAGFCGPVSTIHPLSDLRRAGSIPWPAPTRSGCLPEELLNASTSYTACLRGEERTPFQNAAGVSMLPMADFHVSVCACVSLNCLYPQVGEGIVVSWEKRKRNPS